MFISMGSLPHISDKMASEKNCYERTTLDHLVNDQYTLETIPLGFTKPRTVQDEVCRVKIDHRHVLSFIAEFLSEREYNVGDFTVVSRSRFSDSIEGYFEIDLPTRATPRVKVKITKHLLDGYSATIEDQEKPYICPTDIKYELRFLDNGKLKETGDGSFLFDLNSIFLNYFQRDKNEPGEAWLHRLIYGTRSKELRRHYEIVPEIKYAVNRMLLDNSAETILRFTTLARVIQHDDVGVDAWYLWLSGGATTFTIGAEKYYSKKSAKITSGLPQALYSAMMESPRNAINKIVERKDIASWHRLHEKLEDLALKADRKVVEEKFLRLDGMLDQGQDKIKQEISGWGLRLDSELDRIIDELCPVDYVSVRRQLKDYMLELDEKGLLEDNLLVDSTLDDIIQSFPGRTAGELRRSLSDGLKGLIRKPSSAEHGRMLSEVKAALNINVKSDMGIFIGYYPLAYLASSDYKIPIAGFISYYLTLEALEYVNATGFARLNTIVNLNYVLKELDKDPGISSGADLNNQLNSHLAKVGSAMYPVLMLLAAAGQYFSPRTGGITNYVMDIAALALKYAGMRQWHKFMYSLIERCEKDITN